MGQRGRATGGLRRQGSVRAEGDKNDGHSQNGASGARTERAIAQPTLDNMPGTEQTMMTARGANSARRHPGTSSRGRAASRSKLSPERPASEPCVCARNRGRLPRQKARRSIAPDFQTSQLRPPPCPAPHRVPVHPPRTPPSPPTTAGTPVWAGKRGEFRTAASKSFHGRHSGTPSAWTLRARAPASAGGQCD